MDLPEWAKVLYYRINKVDPDKAACKILGYMIKEAHELNLIRLAYSPDTILAYYMNEAKTKLKLSLNEGESSSHPFSSQIYWNPHAVNNSDFVYPSSVPNLSLNETFNSDFIPDNYFADRVIGPRANKRSPSLPDIPLKVCHYYSKGSCKHGSSCRYFHSHTETDIFSNEFQNDENVLTLEKLEKELLELLKDSRSGPVSIASLPLLYHEKYGRALQAEGYLTESQRHGKAGYSLTRLLFRLKNSICLIGRPHGQHAVILAEDYPKYMELVRERSIHGSIVSGSRQIYLTFPADSTFSELDASHYFSKFGPVQDVRIPCQQKRMFGFVTFWYPETVTQILAKGNPHFVCGARVLVKPYRERSRPVDRRYAERLQNTSYSGTQFGDTKSELPPMARFCDGSSSFRNQLLEEQAIEFERKNLSGLQLTPNATKDPQLINFSNDESNPSEEPAEEKKLPSPEEFSYMLGMISTKYPDQESSQGGLNLPDNPFAPTIGIKSGT